MNENVNLAANMYTMYKLGSLWSAIGNAAKGLGHAITAHPVATAAVAGTIGAGLLGSNMLGNALAAPGDQKTKAEEIVTQLANQVTDPEVKAKLMSIVQGLQQGTVNTNMVVAILHQGGLM
jgi:hypothetical protein